MKTFLISIVFAVSVCSYLSADYTEKLITVRDKIEKQRVELQDLEEEIGQYRDYINALDKKEAELLKRTESIKNQIKTKKYTITNLKKKVAGVSKKIESLNGKLEEARKKHKEYGGYLKGALVEYYYRTVCNDITPWYASMKGSTIPYTCYIAEKLVRAPAQKYEKIQNNIDDYLENKDKLQSEQRNLVDLKEQVVRAQKDFIGKREEHLGILKDIKNSRQKRLKEVKELETEKEKLSSLIVSLKTKVINLKRLRGIAENFEKAKGQLQSPIEGRVISKFGKQKHPQLDTYIINRGIKIKPAPGKMEVSAVAGGEVIFADSFTGMGKMVVISHGKNYYTIYGNLTKINIKESDEVEMFALIGELSVEHSEEPLYFVLGKGPAPLDPGEWLKK
ncbi:MAG: peptidoglycan DD-metalloendopeptidase family protein [Elusimicrobia bacterium]|nr:peptidoglycan DD-metalloendopeptidase family protein [Elusimicrobiota bacterium]